MYLRNRTQQQTSKWLHTKFNIQRGIFLAYYFTDVFGFNKSLDIRLILEKVNKRFLRKLEKKLGFNNRTRLNRLVFIEKGKFRNHTHMMVETPIHISNVGMLRNIKESVDSNNKIVSFEVKLIREKQELIHYLTKEELLEISLGKISTTVLIGRLKLLTRKIKDSIISKSFMSLGYMIYTVSL